MTNNTSKIETLDNLQAAFDGSFYTICGADNPIEWVDGYEGLLAEREIGKPIRWYQTTGAAVNAYAATVAPVKAEDAFPADLTVLLFPLTGLESNVALFKVQMQDRWFDDIVQNMRVDMEDAE